MKTFNIRFRSDEKLRDFIYEKEITDSSDILIQVFSHQKDPKEIQKIITILDELLPNSTITGTTTDGEIIDGRILTKNIVISITVFEYSYLKSTILKFKEDSFQSGVLIAKKIVTKETKAVILFVSAESVLADEILQGIKSINSDVVVSGGLCGDGGSFDGGLVFSGKKIYENGIVAVSLNGDKLSATNRYTSQWEPIGREFKITKSKNNRVYTIDKMSVYKLYEKYLGEKVAKKLPLSGLQFPFAIKDRENGSYIARSVRLSLGDGSMVFATKMQKDQVVQIAFGDAEKMLENTQNLIEDVALNVPTQSVFIYASGGRRRFLQNIAYAEIEPFKMLGDSVGYFGYGEFFQNSKESLFLNQSMSFLVLSESTKLNKIEVDFKSHYKNLDQNLELTKALSNIAKVSSSELQELNQKLEMRVKEEVQKNRDKDSILIHNSKLAQMGEMMSMIAHQWRQPLSAISATSTGLQIKIELGKYDEEFFLKSLGKVEDYVNHLSDTIDDFTNFFKPSKKKENVSTKYLVDKAIFILSPSFSLNSILVTTEFNENVEFATYSNEVVQVLINLLKNAENILLKREILEPKIHINTFLKNSKIYIEIMDNAKGVDDEIIGEIFESYFTTKDAENSTGLGLYMSKFIIENSCGGSLGVENIKDGAKFTIILQS